jgi:hypothetical protein
VLSTPGPNAQPVLVPNSGSVLIGAGDPLLVGGLDEADQTRASATIGAYSV